MRIRRLVWLDEVVEKLFWKHSIETDEVESLFEGSPTIFRAEAGERQGEDVYNALGQSEHGRYLSIFFIHKLNGDALIISGREMDRSERRRYAKKTKK